MFQHGATCEAWWARRARLVPIVWGPTTLTRGLPHPDLFVLATSYKRYVGYVGQGPFVPDAHTMCSKNKADNCHSSSKVMALLLFNTRRNQEQAMKGKICIHPSAAQGYKETHTDFTVTMYRLQFGLAIGHVSLTVRSKKCVRFLMGTARLSSERA